MVRLMQVNVQGKKLPDNKLLFHITPFFVVVAIYSHLIFCAVDRNTSAHTCVNMHLDRHLPSRRLALVTHGSDDRTMNNYTTASHTTELSACGTHRTQMVTRGLSRTFGHRHLHQSDDHE
jgi:hypothetical protein